MADGKASAPKFLDVRYNESNETISFILGNGGRVTLEIARVNEAMRRAAMYHGFNQKVRDSAAGFSKERDFAGAKAAMEAVIAGIYDGSWNRKGGAAAGGAGFTESDIAAAIAAFKKVPFERALAAVEKATSEVRAGWLKNETVKAFAQKAKADRMLAAATGEGEGAGLEIEGL